MIRWTHWLQQPASKVFETDSFHLNSTPTHVRTRFNVVLFLEKVDPTASETRGTDLEEQETPSATPSATDSAPMSPAPLSRRAAAVAASLAAGQQNKHLVTAGPRMGRTRRRGAASSSKQPESPESADRSATVIQLSPTENTDTVFEHLNRLKGERSVPLNTRIMYLLLHPGKLSEPDWRIEMSQFQGQLRLDMAEAREAIEGPTPPSDENGMETRITEVSNDDAEAQERCKFSNIAIDQGLLTDMWTVNALEASGDSTESDHTITPDESSNENEDEKE